MELGGGQVAFQPFALVHHQGHRLAGAAQLGGDGFVAAGEPFAGVHQIEDVIGFVDGAAHLAVHERFDAVAVAADAAGVHHHIGALAHPPEAVFTVAGEAGLVGHQGVAAAGEAVEEGGFADVGPPHQGDHRKHDYSSGGGASSGRPRAVRVPSTAST